MRLISVMFVILIVLTQLSAASGSTIELSVEPNVVDVSATLNFYQNMTALPSVEERVEGDALRNVTSSMEKALNSSVPAAKISNLSLRVSSSNSSINVTASFGVLAIATRKGDLLSINCSWKSFAVRDDWRTGNLSYSLAGRTYIRPVVDLYANATRPPLNATVKAVTFFWAKNETVPSYLAANRAGNFSIFDFSNLATPISRWNRNLSVANGTTTWRLDPGPSLELSIRVQELNRTFVLYSLYHYQATISVKGVAHAEGDVIVIDVGSGTAELAMSLVVLATIVGAAFTSVVYRRRRSAIVRRRR